MRELLSRSIQAVREDQKSFMMWERGELSTEQCLYQCLEHNGYPVDDHNREYWKKRIGLTKFERWLNSEGYIRGL